MAQREVLEVLLNRGDLFDQAAGGLTPDDFTNGQYKTIAEVIWQVGGEGRLNVDELLAREELAEFGALITDLAAGGERRGNYEQTLNGAVEHMLYHRRRQDLDGLRMRGDEDDALREITAHLRSADVRRHPKIQ
jgi:hypothetical protein